MVLWRAVDDEVLDMLVQKPRNMAAAFKLLGTLFKDVLAFMATWMAATASA